MTFGLTGLKQFFVKVWFLWALCLIFNIITFLVILYKIGPSNKTLALHFNILAGVELYGAGKNLYFIPGIGLLITAVNFLLYSSLKKTEIFLNFLNIFATLSVQVVLLLAVLMLARVN